MRPNSSRTSNWRAAKLEQAKAQVRQMEAHLAAAKSQLDAAKVVITQKKAEVKRAGSNLKYRRKQYDRYQELVRYKSIDQRLVDEEFERLESAEAWKDASTAGGNGHCRRGREEGARGTGRRGPGRGSLQRRCRSRGTAEGPGLRRVHQAAHTTTAASPRYFHNGDFIHSASQDDHMPLLVIQRTDMMRLIIQVPDSDVPYCDPGDPVDFSISTVPHLKFPKLKIAHLLLARSQEPNHAGRGGRAQRGTLPA